jgi:hypothetical protein
VASNNRSTLTSLFRKLARKMIESNYYSARMYYQYNLEKSFSGYDGPPILILQMGKVGSSTVTRSLNALNLDMPIYHAHFLSADLVKNTELNRKKFFKTDKFNLLQRPWQYQFLRKLIDKGLPQGNKWKIITLIRDPIARNISTFFENLDFQSTQTPNTFSVTSEYFGIRPFVIREGELDELYQNFFDKFYHYDPMDFFDREIKGVFDIDVYEHHFPSSIGYKIYESKIADLLLIRLENLVSCAQPAFKQFLGIDNIQLLNTNIGNKKIYSPVYKLFKERVVLPENYIREMYQSKFMRHFYSKEEIDALYSKWHRSISRNEEVNK